LSLLLPSFLFPNLLNNHIVSTKFCVFFFRKILDEIREVISDPTKTANVFIQHDNDFKVYNEYCARYPRTMEVLSSLQSDPKMSTLIREQQIQLGHALPLGSYLLKPVQRILKYHLLLQVSFECN